MDDDSLHSLLARGGLSGAQRERALAGALRRARWAGVGRWAAIGAATVLPAAAALVLLLRGTERAPMSVAPGVSLVAKGAKGPVPSARCPDRLPGECHVGDRLLFEVDGVSHAAFFAAYADCAAGARIWYFPTAQGELPALAPDSTPSLVPKAARIGEEHGIGTCLLHLFVLDQPESRASLATGATGSTNRTDVSIEIKP